MTTYIKLEDVHKLYCEPRTKLPTDEEFDFYNRINSLPSINPESMIETEIEKINGKVKSDIDNMYYSSAIITLKELLQKFNS